MIDLSTLLLDKAVTTRFPSLLVVVFVSFLSWGHHLRAEDAAAWMAKVAQPALTKPIEIKYSLSFVYGPTPGAEEVRAKYLEEYAKAWPKSVNGKEEEVERFKKFLETPKLGGYSGRLIMAPDLLAVTREIDGSVDTSMRWGKNDYFQRGDALSIGRAMGEGDLVAGPLRPDIDSLGCADDELLKRMSAGDVAVTQKGDLVTLQKEGITLELEIVSGTARLKRVELKKGLLRQETVYEDYREMAGRMVPGKATVAIDNLKLGRRTTRHYTISDLKIGEKIYLPLIDGGFGLLRVTDGRDGPDVSYFARDQLHTEKEIQHWRDDPESLRKHNEAVGGKASPE